jgi:hypothetical protein
MPCKNPHGIGACLIFRWLAAPGGQHPANIKSAFFNSR